MKQDYWFEPGDKVIPVVTASELGLPYSNSHPDAPRHRKGEVYCIESCFHCPWWGNIVTLVGIPVGAGRGYYARCFRKVEEIRLCVKAAQKVGEPLEIEPS